MHVPCINCCRDYFGRFRSSSRYMLVFILIGSQWILISHWIDVVLSLPSAKICFTAKRSKPYFVALWVPVLSFEFILCGLAIIKGIRTLRKDSQTGGWSCGKTLNVLIKDSILYFIAWVIRYTNHRNGRLIFVFGSRSESQWRVSPFW